MGHTIITTEVESIRQYFRPIQPSIKLGNELVLYKEYPPSKKLANFIYCYWQLKSQIKLDQSFFYRVVSDACIDIFLKTENPEDSFIMGFCKKYSSFELGKEFNYIGIRFLPSFYSLFFGTNAKSLSNKFQELNQINFELANCLKNVTTKESFIHSYNQIFEQKLDSITFDSIDKRFYEAISKILLHCGNIDVEKEITTGLSPRQLRRIFNRYIGTTPKSFANVVRFQNILNKKPSKQSLRNNKIYYELGFYDQAHFIKSFKNFYGITPTEAFD